MKHKTNDYSHVAAVAGAEILLILLCLKCGPEKSLFEGQSGPFPYPYPSNQQRIETPLHMNVRNLGVGVRGRNGFGPKCTIIGRKHLSPLMDRQTQK